MADETLKTSPEMNCSICVDLFRDPVTLPCDHSYCRECLQMFSDRSDQASENPSLIPGKRQIACPLCRLTYILNITTVADFPVNAALAEAVARHRAKEALKKCEQMCSMCEDGHQKAAVTVCTTCDIFYCEECQVIMHPPRGPLKSHTLVSLDEYLQNGKCQPKICSKHRESFSHYCFTCQQVICTQCQPDHGIHVVSSVKSASEKLKVPWFKVTNDYEEVKKRLVQCCADISVFMSAIQGREDNGILNVEKAYKTALAVLEKWRMNQVIAVKQQHQAWRIECEEAKSNLQPVIKGVQKISETLSEVSKAENLDFLQNPINSTSRDLHERLDSLLDKVTVQEDIVKSCQNRMASDKIKPRHLCVVENVAGKLLTVLRMKFSQESRNISTSENGTSLTYKSEEFNLQRAVFRMELMGGEYYWELHIRDNNSNGRISISVGVLYKYTNAARHLEGILGVEFTYKSHEYKCKRIGTSPQTTTIGKYNSLTPHRVGFYLNCEERIFIIIDCNANVILSYARDIDVSCPLLAAVQFSGGRKGGSLEVRVGECACSGLPQILRDTLEMD